MRVTDLRTYPVKSLAGQSVETAVVHRWGLAGDRRWGLVDEAGEKLNGIRHPALLGLGAQSHDDGSVTIRAGSQTRTVSPPAEGALAPVVGSPGAQVRHLAPSESHADAWLSERAGRPVRLVWQPDPTSRPIPSEHGGQVGDALNLSWSGPLLMCSRASLDQLQTWADAEAAERGEARTGLSMWRFRPNVVVDGGTPFAEETWQEVRIGGQAYRVTERCDRCVVTTIDPTSLAKGVEPVRSLARHRRREGKVWFGVRLAPTDEGRISVGDEVVAS